MAQFQNIIITRAGLDMIAQSQAGGTLIFTKGKLGDGQIGDQSIPDLTDLINAKMSVKLSSVTAKTEGHVEVRFIVDNTDLNVGFFVREVGIFAKVNEEGVEQLYGYANAGNYTNYLADKSVPIDSIITKIDLVVGNASNVAFTTDKSIVYVTLEDMENALDTHDAGVDAHEPAFAAHNAADDAHKDFTGATAEAAGERGMVPKPQAGDQNKALFGDKTYKSVVQSINGIVADSAGNVTVPTYTHPNSGVTAGTYRSVTVNAQGHVTAGSNTTITVAQGGTGATTAANARTNLGLSTAITGASISGRTITLTKADGTTQTLTTQDTTVSVNYGNVMPRYTSAVSVNSAYYTAPSNGWVRCGLFDPDPSGNAISINDVVVIWVTDDASGPNWQDCLLPVYKGDVVRGLNSSTIKNFYPCRG